MKYVLFTTIAFGVARFIVPVTGAINKADIFKDMAHIFVGGLFGAAILASVVGHWLYILKWDVSCLVAISIQEVVDNLSDKVNRISHYLWTLAIGLTILEVVAFILLKSN